MCGIGEHGADVGRFQIDVIGEDLLAGGAGGQEIEQHVHRVAQAADGGFAVADGRIDGDAIEKAVHGARAVHGPWTVEGTLGSCWGSGPKQPIPRLQHQPQGAVLTELAEFVGIEHAEGFAGIIGAHHIGWIEDVAQLIAIEAVEVGMKGLVLFPFIGKFPYE